MKALTLFIALILCYAGSAQDCGKFLDLSIGDKEECCLFTPWIIYNQFVKNNPDRNLSLIEGTPYLLPKNKMYGSGINIIIPLLNYDYIKSITWHIRPVLLDSLAFLEGYISYTSHRKSVKIERDSINPISHRRYIFHFTDSSEYNYEAPYMHGKYTTDLFVLLAGQIPIIELDNYGHLIKQSVVMADETLSHLLMKKLIAYIEIQELINAVFSRYNPPVDEHPTSEKISFTIEQASSLMQQMQCIDASRRRAMKKK